MGAGTSAGASESAGEVRFGQDFLIGPAVEHARGGSFPVSLPIPSELTRKIVNAARGVLLSRVFPDRIIRPGNEDFLCKEMARRMPDGFARLFMKPDLSKVRYSQRPRDNYTAFRLFHPATLMNYNLDGLATEYCSDIHRVLTPHGTIPKKYGGPDVTGLLTTMRDYDLQVGPDGLIMSVRECYTDPHLADCLQRMATCSPQFIAIIGYTFGRSDTGHDDCVSLDVFKDAFRWYSGNIYIMEPWPAQLREMLADGIESNNVFGIPCYWNILAHVFIRAIRGQICRQSLNYLCEQILDRHGDRAVFASNSIDSAWGGSPTLRAARQ